MKNVQGRNELLRMSRDWANQKLRPVLHVASVLEKLDPGTAFSFVPDENYRKRPTWIEPEAYCNDDV
jgi:hypothetical protein